MPLYEYECSDGHVTGIVRSMRARHPRSVRCARCPRRAVRIFSRPAVVDDFPEHYNWSMGCVVKNRKHHERLQRERGLQDYVPKKEGPLFSKLRKEGFAL